MKTNPFIKILKNIRSVFLLIWLVVSLLTLGILCVILRIFGEGVSRFFAKLWFRFVALVGGVKIQVTGLEKLDPQQHYILIANHESYLDILALYIALPYKLSFIAKKSLFRIPVFGWGMRASGHISIDRENPKKGKKSIAKAVKTINKHKKTIFAFPEGTRSYTGEMGPFKLGIFSLAMKTDLPLVPIAINGARDLLARNSILVKSGTINLSILEPIDISGYEVTEKAKLANTIRDKIKTELEKK